MKQVECTGCVADQSHGAVPDEAAEEGQHSEEKILDAGEIVKSPGIGEKNKWVKKIREKGIEIISEIELAYRFKGSSRIIAVTGSNGKTASN